PYASSIGDDYAYRGAQVYDPDGSTGTASAQPAALRGYVTAATEQDWQFTGAAAAVTTSGLTADVSVQRSLNAQERAEWEDRGVPQFEIETALVWGDPQPVAVTEVFGLPDLSGQATALHSDSDGLSAWVTAVAFAFERADQGLLQLLLDYPDLAGYFAGGLLGDGRMSGDAALAIVLANLDRFDIAAEGEGADGEVSLADLEAIANDPNAPAHLRDAAAYLVANRLFLSQASIADQPLSYEVRPDDAMLTAAGITTFLQYNGAIRSVALNFDRLDTARHPDQDPDGYVSVNDLRAAADDESLPQSVRDAASFLLANGMLTQRLASYERANVDRMTYNSYGEYTLTDDPMGFTYDSVVALAVDQQAFASDPAAAHRFVLSLPMADEHGDGGLPITLTSDEGVKALANAALTDAQHDLTDQHAVIAHLPETTGWNGERGAVEQSGGVRNTLINGFYDLLAQRADGLFAGPELAGHPDVPGHPGANWLMFAPWASNGVHDAITGDMTVFGITTSGVQQAAADGNQWIFNDIGSRFSAFIELYEQNPRPTEADLERFFTNTFDEGDGTIRSGFAAYVAAMEEDDPVRKQQLLFQGNTLVATHEQAGVQPYLEDISVGPDNIVVRYIDLQVGNQVLAVDHDVPAGPTANNFIVSGPLLSLDTGGLGPGNFVGDQTRFAVGAGSATTGVVDLAPMAGIESFRPEFSDSTAVWYDEGGGDATDPESLAGSGASSWPDWEERMNF
ncbi:MAG: hypothetical protein ACRD0U_07040, partial [Acidimicrobiales bacterium]